MLLGRRSLKYLFFTISRQKAEGKLSFEETLKLGVDIMTSLGTKDIRLAIL